MPWHHQSLSAASNGMISRKNRGSHAMCTLEVHKDKHSTAQLWKDMKEINEYITNSTGKASVSYVGPG